MESNNLQYLKIGTSLKGKFAIMDVHNIIWLKKPDNFDHLRNVEPKNKIVIETSCYRTTMAENHD
jgi:hypothetical protein